MKRHRLVLAFLVVALSPRFGVAQGFTEADRETLRALDKRLAVLEATLKEFKDSVDKRFEQVDKRFEQIDKRFEQVDKRIDTVVTFLAILAGLFATITAATIGFAFWDRRTTLKPMEARVTALGRLAEEDRREVQGLREEVQRLSAAYEEVKALLNRANLL